MSQVNILLFASLKEAVGASSIEMQIPEGASVESLFLRVVELYPVVKKYSGTLLFSVNGEYVAGDERLAAGDEVAFLPPVSGG